MKQYEVIFPLNETEKIIIDFNEPLEQVMYADSVAIAFYLQNKKYLIGQFVIGSDVSEFIEILTKVLHNQLPLHSSLTDLGYLYAQHQFYSWYEEKMLKERGFIFDDNDIWIGLHNLMFSYEYALWIYNDAQGDIIIECAPSYSGPTYDPDEPQHENIIKESALKNFLETYKPLYKNKVPHQLVQIWLTKAHVLEQQIHKNLTASMDDEVAQIIEEKCSEVFEDNNVEIYRESNQPIILPKDGQKALDLSVSVQNSTCRVAVIDNEIIILEETFPDEFHGYVITWQYVVNNNSQERWQAIQEALIKNGLVNYKGEICV